MTVPSKLRLGTRGSPLARWQANYISQRLAALGAEVELVPIVTQGDAQQVGPIGQIGVSGVFTKELQRALLDGRIDFAVHSLKDLPTEKIAGLSLAAVPERGPIGDVLVARQPGMTWEQLPLGAIIGTGSLRRRTQLWHARPDLQMHDVRGNVDTRLRKLHEGQYDALVLAEAGLVRLDLAEQITQQLPLSLLLPAVGQGALGIEARTDDHGTRHWLLQLDDAATHAAVRAERAMLSALQGGCLAPVGAWGRLADGRLHLSGTVLSGTGTARLMAEATAVPAEAEALGQQVAAALFAQGAAELIVATRQATAE